MEIPIATTLSIRDAGLNEFWLQDRIYANPACLGLGELESFKRERKQSSKGRLDILLTDPEDDSMYEVEVMLGETDESHIVRTIEYWDNEKRRWPQRQHYAVLVAESITRRFFNVIQLLSHSIPVIAIQVNLIESEGHKSLHFSNVLDTYEEPDEGAGDGEIYDETYWEKNAPWTIDTAKALLNIIRDKFDSPSVRFVKSFVAIDVLGNNYFWFYKRSAKKSRLNFRVSDDQHDHVSQLLDEKNISFVKKGDWLAITCDAQFIEKNEELFRQIADFVKKTWQ